jgi:hypothetical protein
MTTSTNRVYRADGANSYFLDVARASLSEGYLAPQVVRNANRRLNAHMEEVRSEIARDTPEGRAAVRQLAEGIRSANTLENLRALESLEKRAISETLTGQFSTPQYLLSQWVPFRSPISSFADAARQLPLPSVGYQLHVPAFETAADTATGTAENVGLPTAAPTSGYVADPIPVSWGVGYVTISQQLLDRGGMEGEGGSFDAILADQIGEQLRASIDLYVLNAAIANAATVTNNSSLTTTTFWANVNASFEQLSDSAGNRLQPTHAHTTSDFAGFIRKQIDSEGRPIFLSDVASVLASEPAGEPFTSTGWQGLSFGPAAWFVDDSIPNNATTPTATQLVIWNAPSVLVWRAPSPTITCFPETNADTLSVNLRAVQYIAALAKFASGVCTVSGSAYESLS